MFNRNGFIRVASSRTSKHNEKKWVLKYLNTLQINFEMFLMRMEVTAHRFWYLGNVRGNCARIRLWLDRVMWSHTFAAGFFCTSWYDFYNWWMRGWQKRIFTLVRPYLLIVRFTHIFGQRTRSVGRGEGKAINLFYFTSYFYWQSKVKCGKKRKIVWMEMSEWVYLNRRNEICICKNICLLWSRCFLQSVTDWLHNGFLFLFYRYQSVWPYGESHLNENNGIRRCAMLKKVFPHGLCLGWLWKLWIDFCC